MPYRSTWCHHIGEDTTSFQAAMERLESAGLTFARFDPSAVQGYGVAFFDQVNETLIQFLQGASYNRSIRIFAVALTSSINADSALEILAAGAADVSTWTGVVEELRSRLDRWQRVDEIIDSPVVQQNLIGNSTCWRLAVRQLVEAAKFSDAPILITGESGTGKELAARLVHTISARAGTGPLVVVDCTTIVPELAGSELFGHERGAFTGAQTTRDGAFWLANGGVLFLDEAGELSLPLQAQLLRVTQEHTFKRVGGNHRQHTDFRLVCATNRTLEDEVRHGRFRSDLYHRISGWICRLPPLRERLDDIIPLANYFLKQERPNAPVPDIDPVVSEYLLSRPYEGNVRELRQLVSRMAARHCGSGRVTLGEIADERDLTTGVRSSWRDGLLIEAVERAVTEGTGLDEISRAAKEAAIRIAVQREGGNLRRAAKRLGVTDRALQIHRARWASAS